MKHIVKISRELNSSVSQLGGKAYALNQLLEKGFLIPASYCIKTSAYHEFINQDGLEARISFELSRKSLADCRWEEFWDISLQIRNLFLRQKLPAQAARELTELYRHEFCNMPLAILTSL
ncbi:MAG: PpsA8 [uncultured bacterium]|nr:MAG: PpsA8 [uncultured bacterium]